MMYWSVEALVKDVAIAATNCTGKAATSNSILIVVGVGVVVVVVGGRAETDEGVVYVHLTRSPLYRA